MNKKKEIEKNLASWISGGDHDLEKEIENNPSKIETLSRKVSDPKIKLKNRKLSVSKKKSDDKVEMKKSKTLVIDRKKKDNMRNTNTLSLNFNKEGNTPPERRVHYKETIFQIHIIPKTNYENENESNEDEIRRCRSNSNPEYNKMHEKQHSNNQTDSPIIDNNNIESPTTSGSRSSLPLEIENRKRKPFLENQMMNPQVNTEANDGGDKEVNNQANLEENKEEAINGENNQATIEKKITSNPTFPNVVKKESCDSITSLIVPPPENKLDTGSTFTKFYDSDSEAFESIYSSEEYQSYDEEEVENDDQSLVHVDMNITNDDPTEIDSDNEENN